VISMTEGASAYIYLQDELGSPVRLLDMGGNHQTVYGYDEFGEEVFGDQGKTQPFGYTGYQADNISRSCFAQAREYFPRTGLFGGEDVVKGIIVEPRTLNAYGYCWGNPITFVDLNGKIPLANPSNATKSSSTGSTGNTGQTKSKSSSFYSQEEQWAQEHGYELAENYIPNTSIGLSDRQEAEQQAKEHGYELADDYIPNTSIVKMDPSSLHYIMPDQNKILNTTIGVGYGVYGKAGVAGVELGGGTKTYFLFNSPDPHKWSVNMETSATAGIGGVSGSVGYLASKNTVIDYYYDKGLFFDPQIFQVSQNDNGETILTLLDASAYLVVGGQITVKLNVSKLEQEAKAWWNRCTSSK